MISEKNEGQNVNSWTDTWKQLSIESEIQMWDYYGCRPWIMKYVPRKGRVLEAGCGLGRYNFYLSNLGIDIIGLDFSGDTIEYLKKWESKEGYSIPFFEGSVTELPFDDNSLGGYISLGVIEHFIDGPGIPLQEAFRTLRPGGIAIITTPNHTWSKYTKRAIVKTKQIVKRILGQKIKEKGFFQYEYSPDQLRKHVASSGFEVVESCGSDFLYTFTEMGIVEKSEKQKLPWFYRLAQFIDQSALRRLGAQSITVSVKKAEIMHCFFCGTLNSTEDSLQKFCVPVCRECEGKDIVKYYKKGVTTYFHQKYSINPPIIGSHEEICEFCNKPFITDQTFENFGFSRKACKSCLSNNEINLILANKYLKPVWRPRVR